VALERAGRGLALMALKRTSCDMWQQECRASNVTASDQSGHLMHGYMLPVFFATDRLHRLPCSAKSSPCRNKMLPQVVRIMDWYSIYALLQHAPGAVIYRVEVRTDELRCLTAQKLDCVTSTMCWRIVLLEDKHVSSNAADRRSSLCISNMSW